MTYTDILYDKRDGVAWITINRPEVRNAFRTRTVHELTDAFQDARFDPAVGRALVLLHTAQAHGWKTETLAHEIFLSRSAFAERFGMLVGMPPMSYLASWRMQLAAQRLHDTRQAVAQIAEEVGYASESAFTRAFKREFSVTPAQWRRQVQH